ncbi:metallophosphoesterase [Candidatus Binatia bacterium]|nr:metallophosphoesterase [Candidatus Binatia bacterium]
MKRIAVFATFALVVLTVWIGGHVVMFDRLVRDPGLTGAPALLATTLLVVLCAAVLLQPAAERWLPPRWARLVIWPASTWIGFAFFLALSLGTSEILVGLLGAAFPSGDPTTAAGVRAALVVGAAATVGVVALASGLRAPRLVRTDVHLARWPRALDGFRIVQISDIHIGAMLDRRFAAAVTARVNALAPDLIAITGDLVDGSVKHFGPEIAPFRELCAPHGVYFVTGNHDYYSGADPWLAEIAALGIRPLRNERVTIEADGAVFDLAGVDDHRGYLFGPGHGEDVAGALQGRDPARTVVLLAHDPSTFRAAAPLGVDLQISGHTHGGQIWPFGYFVRLVVTFVAGHYRRGDAQLFVSRGTGFWGPPMRLAAPSEITEITLRSAASDDTRVAA